MRAFVTGASGFLGGKLVRALAARGDEVIALARSDRAEAAVTAAGAARAVRGDLESVEATTEGMRGCDAVFHCAAKVEEWGPSAEFDRINVEGTSNVLRAARDAGVSVVVHVSTEAVLASKRHPIVQADETAPYPDDFVGEYPRTKALAEVRVREAATAGQRAVIVRPRFIWGHGDTTLIPKLVEMVRRGRFAWIGGGRFLTSTCHVDNVVEGMLVAAERGGAGEAYFLTDGPPVEMRDFMGELIRTQGVDPGDRELSRGLAWTIASASELAWRGLRLRGEPPVTRMGIRLGGDEVTVVDDKARRELGYRGARTREEGMAELRRELSSMPSV
jgi:nucleoside-diphosphate-sugar epimerase